MRPDAPQRRTGGRVPIWAGWLALMLGLGPFLPGYGSAAVRYCAKPIVSERGPEATETEARKQALDAWIAEARRFGAAWTSWRLAINRDIRCRTERAKGITCRVEAAPCAIAQNPARLPPSVTAYPDGR